MVIIFGAAVKSLRLDTPSWRGKGKPVKHLQRPRLGDWPGRCLWLRCQTNRKGKQKKHPNSIQHIRKLVPVAAKGTMKDARLHLRCGMAHSQTGFFFGNITRPQLEWNIHISINVIWHQHWTIQRMWLSNSKAPHRLFTISCWSTSWSWSNHGKLSFGTDSTRLQPFKRSGKCFIPQASNLQIDHEWWANPPAITAARLMQGQTVRKEFTRPFDDGKQPNRRHLRGCDWSNAMVSFLRYTDCHSILEWLQYSAKCYQNVDYMLQLHTVHMTKACIYIHHLTCGGLLRISCAKMQSRHPNDIFATSLHEGSSWVQRSGATGRLKVWRACCYKIPLWKNLVEL